MHFGYVGGPWRVGPGPATREPSDGRGRAQTPVVSSLLRRGLLRGLRSPRHVPHHHARSSRISRARRDVRVRDREVGRQAGEGAYCKRSRRGVLRLSLLESLRNLRQYAPRSFDAFVTVFQPGTHSGGKPGILRLAPIRIALAHPISGVPRSHYLLHGRRPRRGNSCTSRPYAVRSCATASGPKARATPSTATVAIRRWRVDAYVAGRARCVRPRAPRGNAVAGGREPHDPGSGGRLAAEPRRADSYE